MTNELTYPLNLLHCNVSSQTQKDRQLHLETLISEKNTLDYFTTSAKDENYKQQ